MAGAAKRPRLEEAPSLAGGDALQRVGELLLTKKTVCQLAEVKELVDDSLAWAAAHGVVMFKHPEAKAQSSTVPCTLLPAPFAADLYHSAVELAPAFHTLMDNITLQLPWIQEALQATGKLDVICGRLLDISARVYAPGRKVLAEEIRLHIVRNDFMLDTRRDCPGLRMKQIELNMIAASFGTHAEDLTEIHRHTLCKFLHRVEATLTPEVVGSVLESALPKSPNAEGLASALAEAHRCYTKRWRASGRPRAVLVLAETAESNEMDHRKLEASLFRLHGLIVLRRSLAQLASFQTTLLAPVQPLGEGTGNGGEGWRRRAHDAQALLVDGHEITVAYFRSGYWPNHYPTEACWQVREQIESSEAVKCPSAPAQLAGMKKVQQMLSEPEQLARFLTPDLASKIAQTFASMSDPTATTEHALRCLKDAKERPGNWVLKPQTEGSGELVFDEKIPLLLEQREAALAEFVLMERVRPPVTPSIVFEARPDEAAKPVVRESVAELGIYGIFVADGSDVVLNRAVGHLLRSKAQQTNQGGVFVGNAVVDAPLLLPAAVFWSDKAS